MGKIRTFVQSTAASILKFWEEFQTTFGGKKTSIWIPETTDTNANAAIKPKGNGANVAQDPDGTTTGGNARGEYATDWQKDRDFNTEVASGDYSTLSGGRRNTVNGSYATISGGFDNQTGDGYTTVSGGRLNSAGGGQATVGGGRSNNSGGGLSTIGGGDDNTASGSYSTVSGGQDNTASGDHTTVGGGENNTASQRNCTIGGGVNNTTVRQRATVSGGLNNTADGELSFVGGGNGNDAGGLNATISGGRDNTTSNNFSTIGGGDTNIASNTYSTVSGGINNTASGNRGSVGGGENNTASGTRSFVSGGQNNTASGSDSVVAGANNTASGGYSSVGGGRFNVAGGDYSFVAGFRANTSVNAPNSVCIGESGVARYRSAFVHSSGTFSGADNGAGQSIQLISRRQADLTTGATTTLHLDGSSLNFEFSSNNAAANILAEWVAVVDSITGTATGVSVGDVIAQDNLFLMKEVGGTASIVGSVTNTATKNDTSQASAAMGYSINASNELVITFTGATFSGGGTLTYRIVHRMLLVEVIY